MASLSNESDSPMPPAAGEQRKRRRSQDESESVMPQNTITSKQAKRSYSQGGQQKKLRVAKFSGSRGGSGHGKTQYHARIPQQDSCSLKSPSPNEGGGHLSQSLQDKPSSSRKRHRSHDFNAGPSQKRMKHEHAGTSEGLSRHSKPRIHSPLPKDVPPNQAHSPGSWPQERVRIFDKSWKSSMVSISEYEICSMAKRPMEELVKRLSSNIKAFQYTLANKSHLDKPGIMDAIIKILSEVACSLTSSSNDLRKEGLQILTEAISDRCAAFQLQLKIYIRNDHPRQKSGQSSIPQEEKIQGLYKLFYVLLRALPASSKSWLPVEDLKSAIDQLPNSDLKTDLLKDVEALSSHVDIESEKKWKRSHPGNTNYREMDIIPSWKEVCTRQKPQLRENIVVGGYCSWLHYYDTQFRLLREDFIAPLRKGICEYLEGGSGRKSGGNVRVYKKVLLQEPMLYTPYGVCYRIKIAHLSNKIDWVHSKRLLCGSLLCLTPEHDNFKENIFFATIVNRDPKGIAMGELVIQFKKNAKVLCFSCTDTPFIMIESCALFGPSQHVLHALQTAEVDTMPFTEYLVEANVSSVGQPRYFAVSPESEYNLSSLLTEEAKNVIQENSQSDGKVIRDAKRKKMIPRNRCFLVEEVANFKQWPSCEQTGLDTSQLKGIHMALTQEIAVIQGPPGTGKTHIGLKIVEALLSNSTIHNYYGFRAPILVMCFTNHALDQFLEGILKSSVYKHNIASRLIRIGGRSKSEELAKYNLFEMRKEIFIPYEERQDKKVIEQSVKHFESPATGEFLLATKSSVTFSLEVLEKVVHYKHYCQFFKLQHTRRQSYCLLEMWLGLDTSNLHWNGIIDSVMSKSEQETSPQESSSNCKNSSQVAKEEYQSEVPIQEVEEMTIEQSHDDEYQSDYAHRKEFMYHPESDFRVYYRCCVSFDKERASKILKYGFSLAPMSKEESRNVADIQNLSFKNRWRLYRFWHSQHLKHLREKCEKEFLKYEELCSEQAGIRRTADCFALETASIIGMTTTGAAKHQDILRRVKPKIVIVEEAAEVLESHIVSALNANTQHLILIGDHKQLRPKPNEYELTKKYQFDVSLFERLVSNGFPHTTLECQHRMRPEIAELVKPHIYSELSNHFSVESYPVVRGVSTNLFFINHKFPEEEDQNLTSHCNDHEAKYLVSLCQYILQQEQYKVENITILVTYTGQQRKVRRLISESKIEGVRVETVDNFQGEENNIILLSLVRSNIEEKVGFLKEENRVCVALSRAQHGFYCIGDFDMLRQKVPLWERIVADVEGKGKLGEGLLLHCGNHPEKNFLAKSSQDFEKNSPEGGCLLDCNFRLECGHACTLKCHFTDPEHIEYKCEKKCINKCPKGHGCPHPCHQKSQETCPPCAIKVPFIMPSCQHKQLIECHEDTAKISCKAKCSHKCTQGHQCRKLCHEVCGECMEPVMKVLEVCNHEINLPCHVEPIHSKCTKACEKVLQCGHKCQLKCGEDCTTCSCMEVVTAQFPDCGHEIQVTCHMSQNLSGKSNVASCGAPIQCKVLVTKEWPCGHLLERPCYQTSTFEHACLEACNKNLACGHPCTKLCSQACDDKCQYVCNQVLSCGHICQGMQCSQCIPKRIHEMCPFKTEVKRYCGHSLDISCSGLMDEHPGSTKIPVSCCHGSRQIECSDEAFYRCHKKCLWRCRHLKCRNPCYEMCNRPKCGEQCSWKLKCGHTCFGLCGEPCLTLCPICELKLFEEKLCVGKFSKDIVYYELLDCEHIFPVKYLDEYVHQLTNSRSHILVCQVQCPAKECSQPFNRSYRYGNDIKRLLPYIQDIHNLLSVNPRNEDMEILKFRLDGLLSNETTSSSISMCKIRMENSASLSIDEIFIIFILTEVIDIFEVLGEHTLSAGVANYKKTMEEFLKTVYYRVLVMYMFARNHMKLTHQYVDDLQREFYRLYLEVYILLVKSRKKPAHFNSHHRVGSQKNVPLTPPSQIDLCFKIIDSSSLSFPTQDSNLDGELVDSEGEKSPSHDSGPLTDTCFMGLPTQELNLELTSDTESGEIVESEDEKPPSHYTGPHTDSCRRLSVEPSILGSRTRTSNPESISDTESGILSDSEGENPPSHDTSLCADLPQSTLAVSGGLPNMKSEDKFDNSASLSVLEDRLVSSDEDFSAFMGIPESPMLPDHELRTRCNKDGHKLVEVESAIVSAEEFLKKLPVKVTKSDITAHCEAMGKPFVLDYKRMLKGMDRFYPVVQKGQWWRCPTKEEYYCLPPSFSDGDKEMKCPKCNGKELYIATCPGFKLLFFFTPY